MKRLPVFLLAALGLLCTLPDVQADAQTCNCATPPTASISVSTVMAIEVPEPIVPDAPNGELALQTLAGADITVEVTYPDIADGHHVGLRWKSPLTQHDAVVQTVSGGARKVTFKIPNSIAAGDLGQVARLTSSVGIAGAPLVISAPQDITVVNAPTPRQFPPPTLPDVPSNKVDIGTFTGDLSVSVNYPSQAQGQIVQVFWDGAASYRSPLKVVPDSTPLTFTIPEANVIASLGKPVTLRYEVSLDGQLPQPSDKTDVYVSLLTIPNTPIVPAAVGGQLDLNTVRNKAVNVTFTYPGINIGHTVGIRWAGNPYYDTPHPVIGATPRPLEFTIPYQRVRQEKNNTVIISGSVGTGSGGLITSAQLPLKIIDTRPKGEQTADNLNSRYNDPREACDNDTPSYYCNGVTIRGTDNGNFDPWDPSSIAQAKGSLSFSYLKAVTKITSLLRSSGFIFLPQNEAIAQNKQQEYLCAYPHDAHTDIVGRLAKGCGLLPRASQPLIDLLIRNPELESLLRRDEDVLYSLKNNQDPTLLLEKKPRLAQLLKETPTLGSLLSENQRLVSNWQNVTYLTDLSTCAGVNAATLPTWVTYARTLIHPAHQCSLSTQSAAQFDTSVKARQYSMPKIQSAYNELLINVWPTGIPAQLPLEAFYYQSVVGLPEAKVYQQKYATRTNGLWLPVIKLDLTQLNGDPFSYNPADQAVQP